MLKNGFTFVEIVIVLLIIGIIAAISIPTYIDMENGAKDRVALQNLQKIRTQLALDYAKSALAGEPSYPSLNAALLPEPYTPTSAVTTTTKSPISVFTDSGGYVFNQQTGEVRLNVVGRHSL